jgi:hypothetical protein
MTIHRCNSLIFGFLDFFSILCITVEYFKRYFVAKIFRGYFETPDITAIYIIFYLGFSNGWMKTYLLFMSVINSIVFTLSAHLVTMIGVLML